jgi:hypothetical protein
MAFSFFGFQPKNPAQVKVRRHMFKWMAFGRCSLQTCQTLTTQLFSKKDALPDAAFVLR